MITMNCRDIATILQAPLSGADCQINSVSTDSRTITPGALFIALRGPNFDGEGFIDQVLAKGAVAVICHRPLSQAVPHIVVSDTRIALGQLAAALKAQLAPTTLAVTGSAGKTTVKEMMAAILNRRGAVLATKGNFNNDIGVPLTLLRLEREHQYAVMELGANHAGEIAYTTSLVKPDVALITNAAASHLEGFGDLFGVARAKAEIYSGLSEDGVAIVSLDSEFSDYWLQRVSGKKLVTFSVQQPADVQAQQVKLDTSGCAHFELHYQHQCYPVQLSLPGRHNVANAVAAAAACLTVGASIDDIQQGLLQMQPVKGRTNLLQLGPKLQVIDDTYNANVESVKAAIDLLASYAGFRVLLLGDMAELGAEARLYHEEIGLYAKRSGINLLFTLGVLSQSASDLFNGEGAHFSSRQAMLVRLIPIISAKQQAVTILVKGSRSANMELVVADLLASCQQESTPC